MNSLSNETYSEWNDCISESGEIVCCCRVMGVCSSAGELFKRYTNTEQISLFYHQPVSEVRGKRHSLLCVLITQSDKALLAEIIILT